MNPRLSVNETEAEVLPMKSVLSGAAAASPSGEIFYEYEGNILFVSSGLPFPAAKLARSPDCPVQIRRPVPADEFEFATDFQDVSPNSSPVL